MCVYIHTLVEIRIMSQTDLGFMHCTQVTLRRFCNLSGLPFPLL